VDSILVQTVVETVLAAPETVLVGHRDTLVAVLTKDPGSIFWDRVSSIVGALVFLATLGLAYFAHRGNTAAFKGVKISEQNLLLGMKGHTLALQDLDHQMNVRILLKIEVYPDGKGIQLFGINRGIVTTLMEYGIEDKDGNILTSRHLENRAQQPKLPKGEAFLIPAFPLHTWADRVQEEFGYTPGTTITIRGFANDTSGGTHYSEFEAFTFPPR